MQFHHLGVPGIRGTEGEAEDGEQSYPRENLDAKLQAPIHYRLPKTRSLVIWIHGGSFAGFKPYYVISHVTEVNRSALNCFR